MEEAAVRLLEKELATAPKREAQICQEVVSAVRSFLLTRSNDLLLTDTSTSAHGELYKRFITLLGRIFEGGIPGRTALIIERSWMVASADGGNWPVTRRLGQSMTVEGHGGVRRMHDLRAGLADLFGGGLTLESTSLVQLLTCALYPEAGVAENLWRIMLAHHMSASPGKPPLFTLSLGTEALPLRTKLHLEQHCSARLVATENTARLYGDAGVTGLLCLPQRAPDGLAPDRAGKSRAARETSRGVNSAARRTKLQLTILEYYLFAFVGHGTVWPRPVSATRLSSSGSVVQPGLGVPNPRHTMMVNSGDGGASRDRLLNPWQSFIGSSMYAGFTSSIYTATMGGIADRFLHNSPYNRLVLDYAQSLLPHGGYGSLSSVGELFLRIVVERWLEGSTVLQEEIQMRIHEDQAQLRPRSGSLSPNWRVTKGSSRGRTTAQPLSSPPSSLAAGEGGSRRILMPTSSTDWDTRETFMDSSVMAAHHEDAQKPPVLPVEFWEGTAFATPTEKQMQALLILVAHLLSDSSLAENCYPHPPPPVRILHRPLRVFLQALLENMSANRNVPQFILAVEIWLTWLQPWHAGRKLHRRSGVGDGGHSHRSSSSPVSTIAKELTKAVTAAAADTGLLKHRRWQEDVGTAWDEWIVQNEDMHGRILICFLQRVRELEFSGARDPQLLLLERVLDTFTPTTVSILRQNTEAWHAQVLSSGGKDKALDFLEDLQFKILYGGWLPSNLDWDDWPAWVIWAVVLVLAAVWSVLELLLIGVSSRQRLSRIERRIAQIFDLTFDDVATYHQHQGPGAAPGYRLRRHWWEPPGWGRHRMRQYRTGGHSDAGPPREDEVWTRPLCSYEVALLVRLARWLSQQLTPLLRIFFAKRHHHGRRAARAAINLRFIADMRNWLFAAVVYFFATVPGALAALNTWIGWSIVAFFVACYRYPQYWFRLTNPDWWRHQLENEFY
uniref:Uncharacterized protein n=1 Tax=Rhizochromulina marina TaxID=1034831 RepID=A0A7S2RLA6_9STRA